MSLPRDLGRCIVVAVLVVLGTASTAAVATPPGRVLGTVSAATGSKVSAFGGYVAWSRPLGDVAHRRYVLVLRHAGVTRTAPIAARSRRPFDVDLGPDENGHVTAVYSRCTDAGGRRGCDLYRYSVATHRESRIPHVNTAGVEQLPAISGARIVFARGTSMRSLKLLVTNLRTGRTQTIRGGTPPADAGGGDAPFAGGFGPTSLDIVGQRVLVAWATIPEQCPGETTSNIHNPLRNARTSTELWLDGPGARHRLIYASCQTLLGPSLVGARVGYLVNFDAGRIYSQSLEDPSDVRQASTILPPGEVTMPVAFDRAHAYYGTFAGSGRATLHRVALGLPR